jgi:hypothetical protein
MSFKRVENTKSIIRASAVSQAQFDLLQKIIAANAGEAKMTRKVLRVIVKDLTSREYDPASFTHFGRAPASVPVEAAPALEAAPELDESHMIDSPAENVSE